MSNYNVIVRKEDGRYSAEVPDLPGCFTEADTLDELNDNLHEAISLYLEDYPCEIQRSSIMHAKYRNPINGKMVIIPIHGGHDLCPSTQKGIMRVLELTDADL